MRQQWITAILLTMALIVALYAIASCGNSSGGSAMADCRLTDLAGNCRRLLPCEADPAQSCLTAGALEAVN